MNDKLQALLNAYVELNKIHAAPGEKAHMLYASIDFIKRMIAQELKK